MKFKSIIIGATGATGQKVLNQLIKNDNCSSITYIGRNKLKDSQIHNKINQIIIKSLLNLSCTKNLWKGHDVFFNCIGTTKKKAGSADKFYEIEYGISNEAARFASEGNIPHACLISASGADHDRLAIKWIHPLFYSKTMGDKEQTILSNFQFKYTSIFKPGMLIRRVKDNEKLDKILQFTGFGLDVNDLAMAMVNNAEKVFYKKTSVQNLIVHGNNDIRLLLKT